MHRDAINYGKMQQNLGFFSEGAEGELPSFPVSAFVKTSLIQPVSQRYVYTERK